LAMGRAAVALTSDATALYWNSARLGFVEQSEVALFHTELFVDDAVYSTAFLALPTLDLGTFGLGYQRKAVTGIERRDDRNQLLGEARDTESSLLFGYGRTLGSSLSLGGALRILQQEVDTANDAGIGFNLGLAYEREFGAPRTRRVGVGVSIENALEPKLHLVAQDVADPRTLKVGAAYTTAMVGAHLLWSFAADFDAPTNADTRFGTGVECLYGGILALRAGLDGGHPTFGCGIAWRQVRLDYALRADDALGRNDRFALAFRLSERIEDRRAARRHERENEVTEQLARQLEAREAAERARARAAGDSALAALHYDDAAHDYRRALALDPGDAAAALGLRNAELGVALARADTLLAAGDAARATTEYQQILAAWPNQAQATRGLERARAQLQTAQDRERQLNALFRDALARFTENDYAGAETALAELSRLDPDHALGRELYERVHTARAARGAELLDRARTAATGGDYTAALDLLAETQRVLGKTAQLTSLQSDWETARNRASVDAAAARSAEPEHARAMGASHAAADLRPAHRTLSAEERREVERRYQAGFRSFQGGDFETATREWQAVWLLAPDYENIGDHLVKAYLYQIIGLYGSGNYAAATDRCRRVLEIDPKNDKALRYLARIQEEQSELEHIRGSGTTR
jgi:tetratricopeptide (TPR) repeat protein